MRRVEIALRIFLHPPEIFHRTNAAALILLAGNFLKIASEIITLPFLGLGVFLKSFLRR